MESPLSTGPPCKLRFIEGRSRFFSHPATCKDTGHSCFDSQQEPMRKMSRCPPVDEHRWKRAAFHYASTGEAEPGLLDRLASSPELLDGVDARGDSLIGVALLSSNQEAAELLLKLAAHHRPSLLDHRSVAKETLLMLAMVEAPAPRQGIRQLVLRDPAQLYIKYDVYGKNAFHHCAEDAGVEALETLLASLGEAATEGFELTLLQRAFEMPDCTGWTPLHYLASNDKAHMLQLLHQFCLDYKVWLDLNVRELGSRRRTPLALAIESGSKRMREFLLAHDQASNELEGDAEHEDSEAQDKEAELLRCMQRMSLLPPDDRQRESSQLSLQLLQCGKLENLFQSVRHLEAIKSDHIQLARLASNPVHCLIDFLPLNKRSRGNCHNAMT